MNRQFLNYYNTELQHLREMGGEFADEFPKIASRLSLDKFGCADPYVERLIESFAFLAARVHHKIDSEFPRFTQSLLDVIYPQYQAPTPSMAIVQFHPDMNEADLAEGFCLGRGTALRSIVEKGDKTACEFRTAHDVVLWPLQIVEASYDTQDPEVSELLSSLSAKVAVRIRLKASAGLTFDKLAMKSVTFYLRGVNDELAMRLYEQFYTCGSAVFVQWRTQDKAQLRFERLPGEPIKQVGFDQHQSMFPRDPRVFDGYRLLREYFSYPNRYMFVEISELTEKILHQVKTDQMDLIIPMEEVVGDLENNVDNSNFALFCTPVINLFEKRTSRIHLSNRFSEFHVVPERARPLDFEVYQVLRASGHGLRSGHEQVFLPLYSVNDIDREGQGAGAYFFNASRSTAGPKRREAC